MSEEVIEIPLRKATYEELQQVICELQLERYTKNKEVEQLKEKIEKAIEYIKENKASLPMGRDEFTCEMRYSDDVVLANKLLEILGDKENE